MWEWPFRGIDILIIGFPNSITNPQISKHTPIDNLDRVILMFGIKVKVGTGSNGILGIRLPNTIFELNNRILDHQVKSKIYFRIHSVNNLNED